MDSAPLSQFILIGVLVVVWTALLIRTAAFVRLGIAGAILFYPESWKPSQCRMIEKVRLAIGVALLPLWTVYLQATSAMENFTGAKNLEAIALIAMISLCYAWTLLLPPRDLRKLDLIPQSFLMVVLFLALWWGAAFSALGWMFTSTLARPLPTPIGIPGRAYADRMQSAMDMSASRTSRMSSRPKTVPAAFLWTRVRHHPVTADRLVPGRFER